MRTETKELLPPQPFAEFVEHRKKQLQAQLDAETNKYQGLNIVEQELAKTLTYHEPSKALVSNDTLFARVWHRLQTETVIVTAWEAIIPGITKSDVGPFVKNVIEINNYSDVKIYPATTAEILREGKIDGGQYYPEEQSIRTFGNLNPRITLLHLVSRKGILGRGTIPHEFAHSHNAKSPGAEASWFLKSINRGFFQEEKKLYKEQRVIKNISFILEALSDMAVTEVGIDEYSTLERVLNNVTYIASTANKEEAEQLLMRLKALQQLGLSSSDIGAFINKVPIQEHLNAKTGGVKTKKELAKAVKRTFFGYGYDTDQSFGLMFSYEYITSLLDNFIYGRLRLAGVVPTEIEDMIQQLVEIYTIEMKVRRLQLQNIVLEEFQKYKIDSSA